MSEIWTAVSEEDGLITFEVLNEATGKTHTQERYKSALSLMFQLGGYPAVVGVQMSMQKFPWRFRKVGDQIYIDGPSVGVDNYHPINH